VTLVVKMDGHAKEMPEDAAQPSWKGSRPPVAVGGLMITCVAREPWHLVKQARRGL
jgi:hypothetical protein